MYSCVGRSCEYVQLCGEKLGICTAVWGEACNHINAFALKGFLQHISVDLYGAIIRLTKYQRNVIMSNKLYGHLTQFMSEVVVLSDGTVT